MKKQDFSDIEKKIIQLRPIYQKPLRDNFLFSAKSRLINRLILIEEEKGISKVGIFGPNLAVKSLTAASIYIIGVALGVIIVSERTLPGQLFYPVKRFNESLVIATVSNSEQEAFLKIEITKRRVDELVQLVDEQQYEKVKKASEDLKRAIEESRSQIEKLPKDKKKKSEQAAAKWFKEGEAKLKKAAKKSNHESRLEIEEIIETLKEKEDEEGDKDGEVKGKKKEKKDEDEKPGNKSGDIKKKEN